MNLIDALKSNRPIKRKEWSEYFIPSTERAVFMVQDVVAEDWEVEEKKISITESQFENAWAKAVEGQMKTDMYLILVKELGL